MHEERLDCVFEALINAFKVLEIYHLSNSKTTTESFLRAKQSQTAVNAKK